MGKLLEQYRTYLRLLAGFHIDSRLASKVDASDVVQETFLEAARDFNQFEGAEEQELVAWLRQILAANLADLVRRHCGAERRDVRLERRLLDEMNSSSVNLDQRLISPTTSPSHRASRREQGVLVADALAHLPEDYAQVLLLRHVESLSFPEIAARLGRSVDSVKKVWARALTKLQATFEGLP
jgi:RNA polymerase sigma-70 factor (ECF subfamily)